MPIPLGSRVRDNITGFSGIAVSYSMWLHGCNRIGIEPTELRDGKPIPVEFFDEQRVELIEEKAPVVSKQSVATSGGPQRDPIRGGP